ncbi:MAG: hypothetical protein ACYC91_08780 [Solirubrobacteraceae bacterium]
MPHSYVFSGVPRRGDAEVRPSVDGCVRSGLSVRAARATRSTSADALVFFDSCRAGVVELLELGAGMDVIEHTIEAYPLDRDAKDALWLWAIARPTRPASFARFACREGGT